MYPLVAIIAVGILRKDHKIYQYAAPFSIIGLIITAYHNLLYYGIIPEAVSPCTIWVSCTTKFQSDVSSNKYVDKINQDQNDGNSLGVNETPTFYINGQELAGVPTIGLLKQKIDAGLNQ